MNTRCALIVAFLLSLFFQASTADTAQCREGNEEQCGQELELVEEEDEAEVEPEDFGFRLCDQSQIDGKVGIAALSNESGERFGVHGILGPDGSLVCVLDNNERSDWVCLNNILTYYFSGGGFWLAGATDGEIEEIFKPANHESVAKMLKLGAAEYFAKKTNEDGQFANCIGFAGGLSLILSGNLPWETVMDLLNDPEMEFWLDPQIALDDGSRIEVDFFLEKLFDRTIKIGIFGSKKGLLANILWTREGGLEDNLELGDLLKDGTLRHGDVLIMRTSPEAPFADPGGRGNGHAGIVIIRNGYFGVLHTFGAHQVYFTTLENFWKADPTITAEEIEVWRPKPSPGRL